MNLKCKIRKLWIAYVIQKGIDRKRSIGTTLCDEHWINRYTATYDRKKRSVDSFQIDSNESLCK